jgi:hypothetical protein
VICVLCQRAELNQGRACHGCVLRLRGQLVELGAAYAAISAPEVIGDPAAVHVLDDGEFEPTFAVALTELPAGTTRSAGSAPISGSREAPVPVSLDMVDLTGPARLPNPTRGPGYYPRSLWPEDQIGQQPVATVLDQWVRDWRSYESCPRGQMPVPTVPVLIGWLGARVDWAVDSHPAVDEFAAEVWSLTMACRRVVGDVPTHPELLDGIPCSCDAVGAMYRDHASQWAAECGSCGRMYTAEEYAAWVSSLTVSEVEAA